MGILPKSLVRTNNISLTKTNKEEAKGDGTIAEGQPVDTEVHT